MMRLTVDTATTLPQNSAGDRERLAAIERAKHEWEGTADALPALVCLLDGDGLVIRANRVVEHWGLGSVSEVVGRGAHGLLHPKCAADSCEVAKGLSEGLTIIRSGHSHEFEFHDEVSEQALQFVLRPIQVDDEPDSTLRDSRAVLVVADVSALRRTQNALERLNVGLESRVQVRTRALAESNRDLRNEVARRERAENELRASRNNLALLSEQLIQAQERERRRIAIELHDSVGQSLSAVKYTLERAIIMIQRPALGSPESVLALAVQRISETAESIRAISMNLRPQMLDDLGAASATIWFCREFAEVYANLKVRADIKVENDEIPERVATHVFRSVQELLNNVAKHAQAKNVWVSLKREAMTLTLEIRDDGIGIDTEATAPKLLHGTGLRNIRERAEMTGGEFSHTSVNGRGTTAQIRWDLRVDEEEARAKAKADAYVDADARASANTGK